MARTSKPFRDRNPVTIGAMVGPEAFTEVKYLMHAKQMQALDSIPRISGAFADAFDRPSGGLVRTYRAEDAETIIEHARRGGFPANLVTEVASEFGPQTAELVAG